MKVFYYVKQLTDEGRLIDVPEYGPHYAPVDPFPTGYETEADAHAAIARYFEANEYASDRLTIQRIYTR